ncbi:MAG: hypothetical protein LAO30_21675 [Acidobacteriia bacterium]|nr:hypothetical protein [Terriglobia bacterium]
MVKHLKNGTKWGDWTLDTHDLVLVLDTKIDRMRHHYEIGLADITDSAHMLDWIFQLRMKAWVTNDVMGDLLSAFQDIFRPQTFLCGAGHGKKLDASAHLEKLFAKAS